MNSCSKNLIVATTCRFNDKPINFFTKTVGTYTGLSRGVAGKYINLPDQRRLDQ